MALTASRHAIRATAYLSKKYIRDMKFWQSMCADMGSRPTYLEYIVQLLATNVGYTNTLSIRCGGFWIYPNEDGVYYVWLLSWP